MENFDKTWIQGWVEAEYRGHTLRFYPLKFEDTLAFFEVWQGNPAQILDKSSNELRGFIAKSLRIKPEEIEDVSSGFLLFGMENLLRAIDIEYLIKGSQNLSQQMQTLLEKVNKASSQLSLADSPEKKDGVQPTS
jgi:hypothetical protein